MNDHEAEQASERAEYLAMAFAEDRAERRKWRKQIERDEVREVQAQAFACLVEALAEMRPYVGTEA